jgi:hypothetical protein
MATLRCVEQLRAQFAKQGAVVVSVALEHAVRSAQQRGRGTQRGETFASFPDAVVVVRTSAAASPEASTLRARLWMKDTRCPTKSIS